MAARSGKVITMLDKIKLALRLADNSFDVEIKALIEACKADLKIAGVVDIQDNNPLFLQAATLYCKGHFGYADISEKYLQAYESLKTPLRLAGDLLGGASIDE